jgi:hypothetical protein
MNVYVNVTYFCCSQILNMENIECKCYIYIYITYDVVLKINNIWKTLSEMNVYVKKWMLHMMLFAQNKYEVLNIKNIESEVNVYVNVTYFCCSQNK